ncbi:transcriptional regulator, TrmB [Caldivirga maquilingensis IC-167]|uniref:Transcriptional regulator, TrmB n=2 Tax=Caldivirga maquilingensis TaxID=76887 RepID=A8MCD6_CALMQ|nr:transcriptional regulator, TrmB [Caldivirga maquilingensis IC-167]
MMGLTNREAEVFLTIAEKGEASVKDILESVDVHQPQLYNILSSLLRRGFIKVSSSRPKKYSAYNLSTIIDTYISSFSSIKEVVKRIESPIRSSSQIYVSYGIDGLNNGLVEVISNAQVELYGEIPSWILRKNLRLFMDALGRGVRLYLLVYPSISEEDLHPLREYEDAAWIKVNKLGDFLLLAADLSKGVYASRRSLTVNEGSHCYIIQDKDIITRFLTIFNSTWKESEDALYVDPSRGKYPRKFLNIHFALLTLEALLTHGYNPVVSVKGILLKNNEPIEVRGVVSSVNMLNRVSNIVVRSNGNQYTIGGYDAELEDIEAQEVVIESISPNA